MNNISVNLENLTDKERDTLLSLIKKANNSGERWKPEEGEDYYYLDSVGSACIDSWHKSITDYLRLEVGNVFRTAEDAKIALKKRLFTTKLEDFARKHNGEFRDGKYYLSANKTGDGSYYVSYYVEIDSQFAREYPMPFFSSRDVALKAIEAIGEENLLRYYFQVI